MHPNQTDDLLEMLKALGDKSRLHILRLLTAREHTVGELAERVELGEPTVSHHLGKLRELGFVTLRMAGSQRFYRTNTAGVERFKRLVNDIEQMPLEPETVTSDEHWIDVLGWPDEEAQVLRDHTLNGVLTSLPTKQKKLLVILRWLATLFQPQTMYSEAEVNAALKAVYAKDFVGLRRDLIDMGYLRRERGGGRYWLAPAEEG